MNLSQFILLVGISFESYFWIMYQISDEFKEYEAKRDEEEKNKDKNKEKNKEK